MIIEIPSTGEQIEAYIVADEPAAPLAVTFGPAVRARYILAPMLNIGWRIVESTGPQGRMTNFVAPTSM